MLWGRCRDGGNPRHIAESTVGVKQAANAVDQRRGLCDAAGMARLPARDWNAEVEKHFRGSASERVAQALRLGREALELFLSTLPAGTSVEQARAILQRNKNRGRRRSVAAGTE